MHLSIPALQQSITDRAQAFVSLTDALPDEVFFAPLGTNKWSVAEHLQHLYLSARPVARLLAGAPAVLSQFEKPQQPSRDYEQLQAAYRRTLAEQALKAPANMSARAEDITDRNDLTERFLGAHRSVATALGNWSDEDLETYSIPHPALGLLTVREMLYFTDYHIEHHLKPIRERT